MNTNDQKLIAQALLYACWYLDEGNSFTLGMRHQKLDGIADIISQISPEAKSMLDDAIESLVEEYRDEALKANIKRSLSGFLQVALRGSPFRAKGENPSDKQ